MELAAPAEKPRRPRTQRTPTQRVEAINKSIEHHEGRIRELGMRKAELVKDVQRRANEMLASIKDI